jgi:DNA-binding XRE family transcriptional regulator
MQPTVDPDGRPVAGAAIEVLPVAVVSRTFPARPSAIPEIRDFVRECLSRSPLSTAENRAVDETVARALLDAAGPTGAVDVTFRIFPDHVEVDVLRAVAPPARTLADGPTGTTHSPADSPTGRPARTPAAAPDARREATSFADWMADVLEREGLTQQAVARRLGVSVKTVGRWVGGETEPRLRDLRRIRELFGPTPFT